MIEDEAEKRYVNRKVIRELRGCQMFSLKKFVCLGWRNHGLPNNIFNWLFHGAYENLSTIIRIPANILS